MKIFNDFDTKGKQKAYNRVVKTYWEENIIFINRSKAYWIMNWILPIVPYLLLSGFFLYIDFFILNDTPIFSKVVFIIIILFWLLFLNYIINVYLSYKFDFSIITKSWIYSHKQIWFFNSKSKDLPANKIRSIESQRSWILWNIFWFWNIVVVTDWSMQDKDIYWNHVWWKTKITYVTNAAKTTRRIIEICLADR